MRKIDSVAVLGTGTMGLGIAALAANKGKKVLFLDMASDGDDRNAIAAKSLELMQNIRPPALDDPENVKYIEIGNFDDDLEKIKDYDWICEAIVEDVNIKREFFKKVEPLRADGSIIATNTSGIPLRDIAEGMPERFRKDLAVTHFFNPVNIMKLMELVPCDDTDPEVIDALAEFCSTVLGKGVVHAKDTVNFIGNRIGCFFMLSGLHKSLAAAKKDGLSQEAVDTLMSRPVGLPGTGLFGLIDLIGLDIMDFVGKNLDTNLPTDDIGRAFTKFPAAEQAMLDSGQLGRKTGGGFYKMIKHEDGSKTKQTFGLGKGEWRAFKQIELSEEHSSLETLLFADTPEGRFAWDLMGGTLCYAADLVPQIADDIVNIDNAMKWGFGWRKGPFEMLDTVGPQRVIDHLKQESKDIPAMLMVLMNANADTFYRNEGSEYLGRDGDYAAV
ncbi:MAG: 3-hydroxyacyl-CoA dehydrogenase [Rhodospirillales bacterium]|nr:3-hydroxyacyl-CoA dehydrogenase [Rhodospirillales bacterium]